MGDERAVNIGQKRITGDEKCSSGNEKWTTGNEKCSAGNEKRTTGNENYSSGLLVDDSLPTDYEKSLYNQYISW